jgi:hypothetical protein
MVSSGQSERLEAMGVKEFERNGKTHDRHYLPFGPFGN